MLGLGETEDEVFTAMDDLRRVGCDILTLGQYLQPTLKHLPVVEFVSPEKFAEYKVVAERLGFIHVASGPMVRSSITRTSFSRREIRLFRTSTRKSLRAAVKSSERSPNLAPKVIGVPLSPRYPEGAPNGL